MTGNRIRTWRTALIGGVGGAVLLIVMAGGRTPGAEDKVPLDKVPRVVLDAAERILPKATWHSAVKVDGVTVGYELDGSDGKDRDVTVLVTVDGKVIEIETQLKDPAAVPPKVLAAVQAKWKQFTPTETHLIRQGKNLKNLKDGEHLYDMRGEIAKGRDIQVMLSADGEILESTVEVALADVPKDVTKGLHKARPNFKIHTAYVIRDHKELVGYHFEGDGPKKRNLTISVSPDGTKVEVVE